MEQGCILAFTKGFHLCNVSESTFSILTTGAKMYMGLKLEAHPMA